MDFSLGRKALQARAQPLSSIKPHLSMKDLNVWGGFKGPTDAQTVAPTNVDK
jgi:hypothetical protein